MLMVIVVSHQLVWVIVYMLNEKTGRMDMFILPIAYAL